jgi:Flp pilus assembly protein TadD
MRQTLFRLVGMLAVCVAALVGTARADDAGDINRLFAAGQTAEAFNRLDQLIAARPRDPQPRFQKGVLLAESQRRAEAMAVFSQLTVDYPEIPEPYNNLAVIHAAQGDYDKARSALEAALRAQPAYAAAHQNLADVYVQLAKQSYAQALRLEPANAAIPPKLALLRDIVKPPPPAPAKALSSPSKGS